MIQAGSESGTPALGRNGWGEVLLVFLVFLVSGGHLVPDVNETHYLIRLKHYWNPDWCQGDLFLESAEAHLPFVWLSGWLTLWLPLPAVAWVGRIACWLLMAFGWQRLSWRLMPVPLAAIISAALMATLIREAHLAGEWMIGGFEAKCVAYASVLLALSSMAAGGWNRTWIWLGAASAMHVLVGGWSALACLSAWWFAGRQETRFRSMLPGLACGGVLALMGVVPALALAWNQPPDLVAEADRIYVFERLPHHLALLQTDPAAFIRRALGFGAMLLVFACIGNLSRRAVDEIAAAVRGSKARETVGGGDASLRLLRVQVFAWTAVCFVLAGFAWEVLLATESLTAARIQKYYWYRLADIAVPLAVSLSGTAVIVRGLQRRAAWSVWALSAVLLFTMWHAGALVYNRVIWPVPRADEKMADYAAWVDVCEWVDENTPPDALFLTPRVSQSFKWRTGRPEVVINKDVPQGAAGIVEWHRRIQDVYFQEVFGVPEVVGSLGELGTQRVAELAKEYGVAYVLTDRQMMLAFPVAYANEHYVVYRMGAAAPVESTGSGDVEENRE